MAMYDIDLGSLAPGEIKNAHRLFKLPYKVERIFYDMSGKHITDKVYGDKGRNGTDYAFLEGVVACCGASEACTNYDKQHSTA
jgi:hypothetical protein